jgi:hypothetical protein
MIIAILISTFISFIPVIPNDQPEKILTRILIFALIIVISVSIKKLKASTYAINIEHKIWEFQRWGYYKRSQFPKPIPFGLIFPFILGLFSLGMLKPFTFLQFDFEDSPSKRAVKSTGQRKAERKDYMAEEDYGYTAAWGFYSVLALAIIGGILSQFGFPEFGSDLAKFSIYFGLWNIVPFGQLDGSRLFYGVFWGWIFITFLFLAGLGFIII